MNHDQFKTSGAAERYILDEMPMSDRNRFEEHFFSCPDCAEEMICAWYFVEGLRNLRGAQA